MVDWVLYIYISVFDKALNFVKYFDEVCLSFIKFYKGPW